jgi:transcription elongation GreA/GreB family factor
MTQNPIKTELLRRIIQSLETDLAILFQAAKSAHAAATHVENIPDNKYATLGLEASYLAQAQANRAQEIRAALEAYQRLQLQPFAPGARIRLTALVTLEDEEGGRRRLFFGPEAGGLKIPFADGDILVITPGSPLGQALLGQVEGDLVNGGPTGEAGEGKEYEIVAVE